MESILHQEGFPNETKQEVNNDFVSRPDHQTSLGDCLISSPDTTTTTTAGPLIIRKAESSRKAPDQQKWLFQAPDSHMIKTERNFSSKSKTEDKIYETKSARGEQRHKSEKVMSKSDMSTSKASRHPKLEDSVEESKVYEEKIQGSMYQRNQRIDVDYCKEDDLEDPNKSLDNSVNFLLMRNAGDISQDVSFNGPIYPEHNEQNIVFNNLQSPEEVLREREEINVPGLPPDALTGEVNIVNIEENTRKVKEILEKAAAFQLRRYLVLYISIIVVSFLLDPLVEKQAVSLRGIFIVYYIFIIYCLIENIIRASSSNILHWKKRDNWFIVLDSFALLILGCCFDSKLSANLIKSKWSLVMPLINFIMYFCQSKAPIEIKKIYLFFRGLLFLQIVLPVLRIDNDFNLPWVYSLILTLAGLVFIVIIYLTLSSYLAICLSCKTQPLNLSRKTQIIGCIWIFGYALVSIFVILVMVGISKRLDHNEDESLKTIKISLLALKCVGFSLCLLLIFARGFLVEFLSYFNENENNYRRQLGLKVGTEDNLGGIQKHKKRRYLVRLTSTYFVPLSFRYFQNRGASLKIRKDTRRTQKNKPKTNIAIKKIDVSSSADHVPKAFLSLQTPTRDKIDNNNRRKNREEQAIDVEGSKEIKKSLSPRRKSITFRSGNELQVPNGNIFERSGSFSDNKFWTEGNQVHNTENSVNKTDQNDDKCYVCYNGVPEAVMVECGHGGICTSCAIEVVKSKGECIQCRQKVTQIMKIDLKAKFDNIIRGEEIITINRAENLHNDS